MAKYRVIFTQSYEYEVDVEDEKKHSMKLIKCFKQMCLV